MVDRDHDAEDLTDVQMGPGETADFELRRSKTGEVRLEVKTAEPGWCIPLPVLVVPASASLLTGRRR